MCVLDMWVVLPMMSLLIRAIAGSPKIHDTTLSDVIIRSGNGSSDIIIDDHIGKPSIDIWKVWKRESRKGERSKEEINPNIVITDELKENKSLDNMPIKENLDEKNKGRDLNAKVVSKRGESIGTWIEFPTKDKRLEQILPKKRNPRLYARGNKRLGLYGSSVSSIRKPIPESFNSWGGKRGTDYFRSNIDLQTKRTYNRDTSEDECIKREAETKNIRFDRWAGKRGEKSNDRKPFLVLWKNPNNFHVLDIFKDGFIMRRNDRKMNDEKQADQMRNWMSSMYEKWDSRRNIFPYPIPFHVHNETNEDDYTAEKEITDIDDWLTLMPEKKGEQNQHYLRFGTWNGKRTFRFGNEHFVMPTYSAKHDNSFLSLGNDMSN